MFRLRGLEIVDGRGGGVGAAGGDGPAEGAWLWLLDFPAGRLLAPVVASAFRGQVALAAWPVRIRDGVVEVAENRLSVAGRGGARGGASANKVLEHPAGAVMILCVRVVTSPVLDGAEGDVEAADQVREPLCLGRAGRRITAAAWDRGWRRTLIRRVTRPWRSRRGRCPRVLATGAAVGQGGAVRCDKGQAETGAGAEGGGLDKRLGAIRVQETPTANLGGGGGPAEQRARRDQDVDEGGKRGRLRG